jgi:outer membrane receptor protein involved in Fe transport
MRSHHLPLGSLAAVSLLVGCDQSSAVSPSAASSADIPVATAAGARPWKESYHSTGTITAEPSAPLPFSSAVTGAGVLRRTPASTIL